VRPVNSDLEEKVMFVESATQDVQVSVGKDFVIMGGDRVEVSPDGKKVTVYTNSGVETKAASSAAATQGISISADFNTVVLNGATIERVADGHLVISAPGTVTTKPGPANDTAAQRGWGPIQAIHEIGARETTGEHKGEIYGGIYPADNKPIWFLAARGLMDHYTAAEWAKERFGSLPTRKQGNYLTTLKGKGAFTEIFNRSNSFPAGYVWLAEPDTYLRNYAWCQRLSDGGQTNDLRNDELPVLSVRR
jgi:hypothetical protein